MRKIKIFLIILATNLFLAGRAWARAGGGGSSSGGGGGSHSGGGGSHFSSSGSSGEFSWVSFIICLIIFGFVISVLISLVIKRQKQIKKIEAKIKTASLNDPVWQGDELKKKVTEIFMRFQEDWSNFRVESMKEYLEEEYYKKIVIELNILKNEGRQNLMQDTKISRIIFMEAEDKTDNSQDNFTAEITASADDVLLDAENNRKFFEDNETFTEYWNFKRRGDAWLLNSINQETEEGTLLEKDIADFAQRNKFYYDPDFGWLMMPDKGVLFNQTDFGKSDINNHVAGFYKDKPVEFYTYIPKLEKGRSTAVNYIVAQTVLPIKYNDILVRRKKKFFNSPPKGLKKIETESNDFNRKFCLWAHPKDQIRSFELLAPDFMEKIYDLPFELNIEVVGKFLYFYAESRNDINYEKMLEIMDGAFEAMKK